MISPRLWHHCRSHRLYLAQIRILLMSLHRILPRWAHSIPNHRSHKHCFWSNYWLENWVLKPSAMKASSIHSTFRHNQHLMCLVLQPHHLSTCCCHSHPNPALVLLILSPLKHPISESETWPTQTPLCARVPLHQCLGMLVCFCVYNTQHFDRNLCTIEWCKDHRGGTISEFTQYWDGLIQNKDPPCWSKHILIVPRSAADLISITFQTALEASEKPSLQPVKCTDHLQCWYRYPSFHTVEVSFDCLSSFTSHLHQCVPSQTSIAFASTCFIFHHIWINVFHLLLHTADPHNYNTSV